MALFIALAAASIAWLPLTIRRNWTHFEADARGLRWSGPLRSSVIDPFDEDADVRNRLVALGPAALAKLRRILDLPRPTSLR